MGISKKREDETNLFYTFLGYFVINEPTGVARRMEGDKAVFRAYQRDFKNVADHIAFHKIKRDVIWIQTLYGERENLDGHKRKILSSWDLPYRFHIIWHRKKGRFWDFERYVLIDGLFYKDMGITDEVKQRFKEWKKEREKNKVCILEHPHTGKHKYEYS